MCEPVSASMAALSVMQMQQQQQAAQQQAAAQNRAYERNQQLQNEAYQSDMEAYWNEEVAIQGQAFETAEAAAEARLDALIKEKQQSASLFIANMEDTGGGATPTRQLGFVKKQLDDALFDIDQQFQANVAQLKGQRKQLSADKVRRRYQAISAINQMPQASYQSSESQFLNLTAAGLQGYSAGGGFKKTPSYKKVPSSGTTNTSTMSTSDWEKYGRS